VFIVSLLFGSHTSTYGDSNKTLEKIPNARQSTVARFDPHLPFRLTTVMDLASLPPTPRSIPDVPENIDLYMEHLNDPNYEFTEISSSHPRLNERYIYEASDVGTESHYGSDRHLVSKTESLRTSTAIDFEEYGLLSFCFFLPVIQLLRIFSESSYPEVRAAVANVDDPSMPLNTFRM